MLEQYIRVMAISIKKQREIESKMREREKENGGGGVVRERTSRCQKRKRWVENHQERGKLRGNLNHKSLCKAGFAGGKGNERRQRTRKRSTVDGAGL